jgi:hypothetical protein
MAKGVSVKDNTANVRKVIGGLTGDALDDFGDKAKNITKQHSPARVHLGANHRSNIEFTSEGSFGRPNLKKYGKLFSQSNYGVYLEFGTHKMAARPHFRPGIAQAVKQFQDPTRWRKK